MLLLASTPSRAEDAYLARARALLTRSPVIDGHVDVPEQLLQRHKNQINSLDFTRLIGEADKGTHTDLTRLKAGGYGGVFWSVYVPVELGPDEAVRATLDQIDVMRRLIDRYPDRMMLAATAAEARGGCGRAR